ncbi:MAG: hypothetical protein IMZ67_08990, partial [Acidobacteria bacterium]|nr:hypothetical protein [Acidobacteriota bacterium]
VLAMIEGGADATHNPRECLALGRLFEQTGQGTRAEACYVRAAHLVGAAWDAAVEDEAARGEALRSLALRLRRERRYNEAAVLWHQVLEISVSAPDLQREAIEALAIHHEHRSRDLDAALSYALRGFEREADDRFRQELERRLARLKRKMTAR